MAYESKFVLIGYFSENQEAGTVHDRDQFSQDVENRFDQHITTAAQQAGLDAVGRVAIDHCDDGDHGARRVAEDESRPGGQGLRGVSGIVTVGE